MTNLTISHTTDTTKLEGPKVSHTTDSDKKIPETHAHTTDAFVKKGMVLAQKAELPVSPTVKPELSKNSTILISIGDGMSVIVGFLTIATWNTPGRPSKPKAGTIGFNSQTQAVEIWDGNYWFTTTLNPA